MQVHFSGSLFSRNLTHCQFQGNDVQPGTDPAGSHREAASSDTPKIIDRERLLGLPALILAHMPLIHSGADPTDVVKELETAVMPFLADETKTAYQIDPALGRCLGELNHSLANEFMTLSILAQLKSRPPEFRQKIMERLKLKNDADLRQYAIERMSNMVSHSRNWLGLLENRQSTGQVAEAAFDLLGKDITLKQLTFSKPETARLDPYKIPGVSNLDFFSMLFHPLHNACKYTPHGNVDAGIRITQREDGTATLQYTVKDSGIGMPPKIMDLVNDPEAHYPKGLRGENVGETSGTGFGMPELKALVLQAGGSIKAGRNPDGPGTLLTLKLPLVTANPASGTKFSGLA